MANPIAYQRILTHEGRMKLPIYRPEDVAYPALRISTPNGVGCCDLEFFDFSKYQIRYIRDWCGGISEHATFPNRRLWQDIYAIDTNGINVALGKSVTYSTNHGTVVDPTQTTDGIFGGDYDNGAAINEPTVAPTVPSFALVDLGDIYTLHEIIVWHEVNGTSFKATKLEVSTDNKRWQVLFDSATQGEYIETYAGKTHKLLDEIVLQVRTKKGNHFIKGIEPDLERVPVRDTFDRPNSTVIGNADTGQRWKSYVLNHTWGIQNNQAYPVIKKANHPLFLETYMSDNIAIVYTIGVMAAYAQFMWRIDSPIENFFALEETTIYRAKNTQWSTVTTIPKAPVNGDVLRIELRGNEHKIFINGVLQKTFTHDDFLTGSRHGFGSDSSSVRINSFEVIPLEVGT